MVDYYSLGALFYEMIFGIPPFYDPDLQTMKSKMLSEILIIPKDPTISKECRNLIGRLLEKNPSKRIGINCLLLRLYKWS